MRSASLLFLTSLLWIGCSPSPDAGETGSVSAAYSYTTNYALYKPATQSSEGWGGDPSRAVDGNTDGVWNDGSVTHTDDQTNAWWQVDLLQIRNVSTINIYGRTDPCCTSRLSDFWVLASDTPFSSTDLNTTLAQNLLFKQHITGTATLPVQSVSLGGKLVRYVRIQLAGTNYLSLAEVQVLDSAAVIPGPDAIATAMTPVATGLVTASSGVAMTDASDSLRTYVQGANGQLAESIDLAAPQPVPNSVQMTADPIAAITDRYGAGHTFVAARDASGFVNVAERDPATGAWTWSYFIRPTDLAPSIAIGCGYVYVSTVSGQQVTVIRRPLGGGYWSVAGNPGASATPATLAASPGGDVGVAFIGTDSWVRIARASCSTGGTFAAAVAPGGTSHGASVGLASYGNLFGVAVQGTDNRPYFAMQQHNTDGSPMWTGFEAVAASDDATTYVEAPTVIAFRGIIFMAARDAAGNVRAWFRNPNLLTRRSSIPSLWIPQNVVATGPYASPPAFAIRGSLKHVDNYSIWENDSDAELYVTMKRTSDNQLFAFNLGRDVATNFMVDTYGLAFNTNQEANGVRPAFIPNYFDLFATYASMPSKYWAAFSRPSYCTPTVAFTIMPVTNYPMAGHTWTGACGTMTDWQGRTFSVPALQISAQYPPWAMWNEYGHELQTAVAGFKSDSYNALFAGAQLLPKFCSTNADCGGGTCAPACSTADSPCPDEAGTFASQLVCRNPSTGEWKWRPQGFVEWYDVTQDEHSFLDFVEYYRWWGDELREWRDLDAAQGNTLLQQKYDWVKANYYDGVEFNGRRALATTSNRNAGTYGMPLN